MFQRIGARHEPCGQDLVTFLTIFMLAISKTSPFCEITDY
jgi:hypothetical protein